jgi:hypothetical protein
MLLSHNDTILCFLGKDYEIVRALVKILPFLFEQQIRELAASVYFASMYLLCTQVFFSLCFGKPPCLECLKI